MSPAVYNDVNTGFFSSEALEAASSVSQADHRIISYYSGVKPPTHERYVSIWTLVSGILCTGGGLQDAWSPFK